MELTPFIRRHEVPHGQGVITYVESNERHKYFVGQEAPDPIRQSDTPTRAPSQWIAIMSTRTTDWNSGFAEEFLTDHRKNEILRLQPSPLQRDARAMQSLGTRPNIAKPDTIPYASFFEVTS